MPIIINILPNVFWIYNNPSNIQPLNDYNIDVSKFVELNHISTIIELDDKVEFWKKSSNYINEIKLQMEKDEFSKLYAILKKINDIVKNAYITNGPCIISTYNPKYIEIGLAIWIFFFNQTSGMSFDNVIKLMSIKVIGNISLSDTMKKFFAFLNLNQMNQKK
jgi:hypothetical protein